MPSNCDYCDFLLEMIKHIDNMVKVLQRSVSNMERLYMDLIAAEATGQEFQNTRRIMEEKQKQLGKMTSDQIDIHLELQNHYSRYHLYYGL